MSDPAPVPNASGEDGRSKDAEIRRLRDALDHITKVEPTSETGRLGVVEWSNALDAAQRIAAEALDV